MTDLPDAADHTAFTTQLIEESRELRAHSARLRQEIRKAYEDTLTAVRAFKQLADLEEPAVAELE